MSPKASFLYAALKMRLTENHARNEHVLPLLGGPLLVQRHHRAILGAKKAAWVLDSTDTFIKMKQFQNGS